MESNFVLTDIKPTSQARCWQLLLDGYILEYLNTFYGFHGGFLVDIKTKEKINNPFKNYTLYQVYQEQDWTDLLEDGPILCSTIYDESGVRIPMYIDSIREAGIYEEGFIYRALDGGRYKDAIPITLEELKPYLLEYRIGTLK